MLRRMSLLIIDRQAVGASRQVYGWSSGKAPKAAFQGRSERTFRTFPGATDLHRPGTASQLRFDGCSKAVRTQRVLTLEMQANGREVVIRDGLQDQFAIGALPGLRISAQRPKGRVRRD